MISLESGFEREKAKAMTVHAMLIALSSMKNFSTL